MNFIASHSSQHTAESKHPTNKLNFKTFQDSLINKYQKTFTMKTTRTDFRVISAGHGHWEVTYQSPVTFKRWVNITTDSQLIDAFKSEEITRKELEQLKRICKRGKTF
jgi:hypothetical protein